MIDNVYDLAQLVHQQRLEPVTIIGHSRGGSIALQYAGGYPAKVEKLVAIEGLGPRRHEIQKTGHEPAPQRMAEWIEHMRALASRVPRRYASIEDAVQRMHEAKARHLTIHGTNQNEDGTYSWKFDPYTPGHSPYHTNENEARELWGQLTCPTLLVGGGESWAGDPRQDGKAKLFPSAEVVIVPNAGHWVYHDQLDGFVDTVRTFLAS